MARVDIRNFTRGQVPRLPFVEAAARTLPGWDISLVFAGEVRAKQLNRALRGKDYVPNVLSYAVGKKNGEIIICPPVAKRQASSYGLSYKNYLLYLFIHGCVHLAGEHHGPTMERKERAILARFASLPTPNGSTHRHRH
jgi:probable rRNA maturation factor